MITACVTMCIQGIKEGTQRRGESGPTLNLPTFPYYTGVKGTIFNLDGLLQSISCVLRTCKGR